jgi:hypothetical protein
MNIKLEINHAEYMKKVKTMSNAELAFTIKDAGEAIKAMPDNPKVGYYFDEIHYCQMELNKRRGKNK